MNSIVLEMFLAAESERKDEIDQSRGKLPAKFARTAAAAAAIANRGGNTPPQAPGFPVHIKCDETVNPATKFALHGGFSDANLV